MIHNGLNHFFVICLIMLRKHRVKITIITYKHLKDNKNCEYLFCTILMRNTFFLQILLLKKFFLVFFQGKFEKNIFNYINQNVLPEDQFRDEY